MDFGFLTKEQSNWALLCYLLMDVGTNTLRRLFDKLLPPENLREHLNHNATILKSRINTTQWKKLYSSPASSLTSKTFDITLLTVLFRTIPNMSTPATGWNSLPPDSDRSDEANIVRVRYYRNWVYANPGQMSLDDAAFNQLWQKISRTLIELGADATAVKELEINGKPLTNG